MSTECKSDAANVQELKVCCDWQMHEMRSCWRSTTSPTFCPSMTQRRRSWRWDDPPLPPVSHIDPCDPFNAQLMTLPCWCCCTRLESSLTISSINFNISSHLGRFLSLCGWAWVMYPIIRGVVTHLMNSVIWPLSWLIQELPHCSILNTYVLYILLSSFLYKVA